MANRILVLWPSGDLLCEGESALTAAAPEKEEEPSPETEPCPPTKRSPEHESGIFRRGERAA